VDVFGVPRLPYQFRMGFALQLRFPESEAGKPHQLTLATYGVDPLMRIGQESSWDFTPTLGQYRSPGWQGIYAMTGAIDLSVESAGTHSLRVMIDSIEANDIPFQVFVTAADE
jgi:hypothetical protein